MKAALGVPDPYRVVITVAVAYPGRLEDLDPEQQEKELHPRTRKPLDEVVCRDRFDHPLSV